MTPTDFSAAGIRALLQKTRDARLKAENDARLAAAAEMTALREAFETRELPPDALPRVIAMVKRALEAGEKEVLVFRFPSDFMADSGRSITSHVGDWRAQLTGAARTAHAFYVAELEPLGFTLKASILDYKDGMPGDVGLILGWALPEA